MRWARPLLDYQACPPFQFRGGHHYSRISRSLSSGAHSRDPVAHAGYLLTWVADRPISEKRRPQRTFTNAPARARGHSKMPMELRNAVWNQERCDRALGLHIE